ncbi:catalase-like [Colias croceus]|uniref:catalase-like n=1 Tax=Colias crocea TaxID=72248 RepID=UPI001E27D528|nr:catalase-like [Colias croceus]
MLVQILKKIKKIQIFIALLISVSCQCEETLDPVRDQILLYKKRTEGVCTRLTTSNGAPVESRDTSTLNENLMYNSFFMDSLTRLTRERIQERVVHGKGTGATGYLEVTNNISQFTKADFLNGIGKKTPVAVRFSPTVVERGGSDMFRAARGFAVKFYTQEGNFDFLGFSTPMFVMKDPILFPAFIHSQRRNPSTGIRDNNMLWDFLTLNPEALNMFITVFGDDGIPRGYRHMPGFSIHTYQMQNKEGDIYFARLHFQPDAGKASITTEEARYLDATDPDYFSRDLYEAIACGKQVSWTFFLQILTLEQALNSDIDVFDVTLELPTDEYPLTEVGKLVLNKNPLNQFAEVEQLAFCPCNLVPGIDGAPDKLFQARTFVYRDTHMYRLDVNVNKIKVNRPIEANTYNRDGKRPVGDNGEDTPNYYPNSFNGPKAYSDMNRSKLIDIVQKEPNNTAQAGQQYRKMSDGEKERFMSNLIDSLGPTLPLLRERAVKIFTEIDRDLGSRVYQALKEYQREPACNINF